eukprot:148109-Lingulodinium_polyedra.AAC.1
MDVPVATATAVRPGNASPGGAEATAADLPKLGPSKEQWTPVMPCVPAPSADDENPHRRKGVQPL